MRNCRLVAEHIVLMIMLLLLTAGSALAQGPLTIEKYGPWGWPVRCVGWRMRYNIDVTNEGSTTLHNVYISDPLPEGTYPDDTVTTPGYSYGVDGNGAYSLIWDLGDMGPGDTVQKWLELNTQARREPGYLENTAYVFCDELSSSSSSFSQLYVSCETPGPGTPTVAPVSTLTPTPTLPGGRVEWTLQQGANYYDGTEDTYLSWYLDERDCSYAHEGRMALRSSDEMSGLVKFDVSTVPTDALVQGAFLDLNTVDWGGGPPLTVSVHRVARPWVVTEATWISATNTIPWAVGGCSGEADRDTDSVDTVTFSQVGSCYTLNITPLVAEWVANPTANQGMILRGTSDAGVRYNVASAEHPTTEYRPRLRISFLQPTQTPTPTPTGTHTSVPTLTPTATPRLEPTVPSPTIPVLHVSLPFILKGFE